MVVIYIYINLYGVQMLLLLKTVSKKKIKKLLDSRYLNPWLWLFSTAWFYILNWVNFLRL